MRELLTLNIYCGCRNTEVYLDIATGRLVSLDLKVKIVFFNQIHKVHFLIGGFLKINGSLIGVKSYNNHKSFV